MSKRHTDLMIAIGMAGGVVDTYLSNNIEISNDINKRLTAVKQSVSSAIFMFGRVGNNNIKSIADKIDRAKMDDNILGSARSIISFVDYAVWMLESSLQGVKPPAMIKGNRGKVAVMKMINSLVDLRNEIAEDSDHFDSAIEGINAAERMMQL